MLGSEIIEVTECTAGEIAQLRVVSLPLKFGHNDNRQDDVVFRKSEECAWIREQHGGVEHIGDVFRIFGLGRIVLGSKTHECSLRHQVVPGAPTSVD